MFFIHIEKVYNYYFIFQKSLIFDIILNFFHYTSLILFYLVFQKKIILEYKFDLTRCIITC